MLFSSLISVQAPANRSVPSQSIHRQQAFNGDAVIHAVAIPGGFTGAIIDAQTQRGICFDEVVGVAAEIRQGLRFIADSLDVFRVAKLWADTGIVETGGAGIDRQWTARGKSLYRKN